VEKEKFESLVTVDGLAQYLSVKKSWVYEQVAKRSIPCKRVGKYLRFRISEVELALATGSGSLKTQYVQKL
jgi:excisionase family DNA binding protein